MRARKPRYHRARYHKLWQSCAVLHCARMLTCRTSWTLRRHCLLLAVGLSIVFDIRCMMLHACIKHDAKGHCADENCIGSDTPVLMTVISCLKQYQATSPAWAMQPLMSAGNRCRLLVEGMRFQIRGNPRTIAGLSNQASMHVHAMPWILWIPHVAIL